MSNEQKEHLKKSIEALKYSKAVIDWQIDNLKAKLNGGVSTMGDPPKDPPPIPCPTGWYESEGRCVLDVG